MAKKLALGKGIASLIQEAPQANLTMEFNTPQENAEVMPSMVDIEQLYANPNQPRKIFKEKELEELSTSIRENGIIQPLIVTKQEFGYEVIAGERRLRAAKMAGVERIPVVIKTVTDREKLIMSIIENVQRSDLNCVEEALAYFQLMDDFKLTQEEVAAKLGKERSTIANFLRVLKLPRTVIELLQKEQLTFGHAKLLASVKDRDKAIKLAVLAAEKAITVRELEKIIKTFDEERPIKKETTMDPRFDQLRQDLEQKTGFHLNINCKKNGAGQLIIKFNNENEFNTIYDFLLRN